MGSHHGLWVTVQLEGTAMERISLPFFYNLGARLNPLAEAEGQKDRLAFSFLIFKVQSDLKSLLDRFPSLVICRSHGLALLQAMDKWVNELLQKTGKEMDFREGMDVRAIISMAKTFETVLAAELEALATYHVTQKGIYSTPDLVERADNTLPESAREKIPEHVAEELRQSGRCLAFDNATASAFHMMRATELVIHEYYLAVSKPKSKKKLDSWGAYIAKLRQCPDQDVQKVVAILQQIKDQDRNLIMHPEMVLSPDEAFTLFEVGQGAIIAMANKLKRPRKRARQPIEAEESKTA
jgi:hypothetical protein